LLENSRHLRHHQTDAENLLWRHIRGRRLQEFRFKRQKVIGEYIVDFYCAKAGLIIELDGGQHAEDSAIKYDQERTSFLQEQSFRVIRFWNNEVLSKTEDVLMAI